MIARVGITFIKSVGIRLVDVDWVVQVMGVREPAEFHRETYPRAHAIFLLQMSVEVEAFVANCGINLSSFYETQRLDNSEESRVCVCCSSLSEKARLLLFLMLCILSV